MSLTFLGFHAWCFTCSCELEDEFILAIHLAAHHEVGPKEME